MRCVAFTPDGTRLISGAADGSCSAAAGRHRNTDARHFVQTRSLAAKKLAHVGAALCLAAAEGVDPLARLGTGLAGAHRLAPRLGGDLDVRFEGIHVLLEPEVFGDARGFFFESYNKRVLAAAAADGGYRLQVAELHRAMPALLSELQQAALQLGFALQMGPSGIISAPLVDGKPLNDEQFAALPEERREQFAHRRDGQDDAEQQGAAEVGMEVGDQLEFTKETVNH